MWISLLLTCCFPEDTTFTAIRYGMLFAETALYYQSIRIFCSLLIKVSTMLDTLYHPKKQIKFTITYNTVEH